MMREPNPFLTRQPSRWPTKEIFCPHPYTNWSLNPTYAVGGVLLHTAEGFRRTGDEMSVVETVEDRGQLPVVYCMGGSTTYCSEIYGLGEAWPDQMRKRLEDLWGNRPAVVNAGVGGWNTINGLIRFFSWGPRLKPDITIVYASKNDLTPFFVGDRDEINVMPDHQNIVSQFGWRIGLPSMFKRRLLGIDLVYADDERRAGEVGLARFDQHALDDLLARYKTIISIAQQWGGKVVFVREIMRGGPYALTMDQIFQEQVKLSEISPSASAFDPETVFPDKESYYYDKMHFTEEGCRAFGELMASVIGPMTSQKG